ncbi:hypothetical protein KR200_002389 [Drosophila serrata]|nr:hypothetical protein KR200_002389 [Drosophila serrata]
MSMRKPRVKPMRHCTADDSDPEQATGEQDHLESASSTGRSYTQGIRTNRNLDLNHMRSVSSDEDEEDDYDSDVNDIINDDDLDGDDEEMSDEPRTSTSKSKKAPWSRRSPKSDSDEDPMTRVVKHKTKRLIYSDSDSD